MKEISKEGIVRPLSTTGLQSCQKEGSFREKREDRELTTLPVSRKRRRAERPRSRERCLLADDARASLVIQEEDGGGVWVGGFGGGVVWWGVCFWGVGGWGGGVFVGGLF